MFTLIGLQASPITSPSVSSWSVLPSGIEYSIALSEGGGILTQRVINSGAHALNYNLYTGPNRSIVWGDTTSGTARVSGTATGVSVNHAVYGRIPALQNVHAGSYADMINVILAF